MKFTDLFIRRPVLATVVSLLILVVGLRAIGALPVLQYPRTENAVVTVTTTYYGADPDVIAGFITTPLEQAIAQANGIDYMTSTSQSGVSTITVYLRLNYDSSKALTEINTKVGSVLNRLPSGTQQPVLTVKIGQTIDAMYIGFNSTELAPTVVIDRDKASQLGLKMSDIGGALGSMLGGGYVNYFALDGRSYKVIPQVQQSSRLNVDQVLDYHIRAADGASVPLSTVAKIVTKAIPQSLNHFQQLNSATIQGVAFPGVSQAEALETLKDLAARTLPQGYSVDYGGASRQYMQETGGFVVTFGFALIIIYLSLAALFESFRDPLIILFSVPMSIAGALVFLMALSTVAVPGATLNIYTQVGLVTLMGLISKHGILIVEVANELQQAGKSRREAIEEAAAIRLRPILMTTAAMVLGVVPLIVSTGAGALSRFSMGLVIASGLAVGTLFTLFVVPAVYVMLAADHSRKQEAGDPVEADAGD